MPPFSVFTKKLVSNLFLTQFFRFGLITRLPLYSLYLLYWQFSYFCYLSLWNAGGLHHLGRYHKGYPLLLYLC